ncbi:hypothetical protein OCH80_06845 [Lactobacillus sp. 23-2]|uniref:hypothetical protein n=1 Tax=Lactobacillus sp. 23-2 TaxID=2981842 RepID=UPI003832A039
MKSKLIDIFYFGLAGTSGTLSVMSLLADHKASSIILDVLGLIISAYFVIRGFLDIKSENAKLDKNWQILSWIAWSILLIGVCVAIGGYKAGNTPVGWGGFIAFLVCCFIVPEQANDKNFHVKSRDDTGFDDKR